MRAWAARPVVMPSPHAISVSAVNRATPNPPLSYAGTRSQIAALLLFGIGLAVIGRRRRGMA